jgi:thiosulfate reductase cytochrome b subunit
MLLNFLLVLMIYLESFNSKTLKMFHILLVLTSHVRRCIYLSSSILYSWNNAPMFKLHMGNWIQEIPLPEFWR